MFVLIEHNHGLGPCLLRNFFCDLDEIVSASVPEIDDIVNLNWFDDRNLHFLLECHDAPPERRRAARLLIHYLALVIFVA